MPPRIAMGKLTFNEQGVLRSSTSAPPTHYTVEVQNFSVLTKNNIERYTSGEFEAGGYKWKLVMCPNGNKNKNIKDHISLYLMLVDAREGGSTLRLGWEVHAVFRLFLLDQNQDNYLVLEDGTGKGSRFHGMKPERGFDDFIPLKLFNEPSKGYLVNDTCVFGAEVFVCREKNSGKGECLSMIKNALSNKHNWRIGSFSKLINDCEDSATFNAGDHKWKIQIYPKGKGSGTGTHVSLYLALADDPALLPPTSKIYVDFTLRILDQIQGKHYFGKATFWFSASNQTCGWPKFISIGYFNLPSVGFLYRDACWVEADVTVHGAANAL